jgi:hypothetical protein
VREAEEILKWRFCEYERWPGEIGRGRGEGDSPPFLLGESREGRGVSIGARLGESIETRLGESKDGFRVSIEGPRAMSIEGRRGVEEGLEGAIGRWDAEADDKPLGVTTRVRAEGDRARIGLDARGVIGLAGGVLRGR